MKTLVVTFARTVPWSSVPGRRGRTPLLFALLFGFALLSGCGGAGGQRGVSVVVSPATRSVDQGATIQFSATVSGTSNHAVTWSIQEGTAGGSITQNGLYTAPPVQMQVHVVVTSVADPSKSANSVVSVNPVSIVVSPATRSVDQGEAVQFSATVSGTSNHAVTWSVQEGSAGGSITQNGLYTAPTTEMKVHVVATIAADPSKFATAELSVNAVSVSLPSTIKVARGRQRQFTGVVTGTVLKDVIWTIQEGAAGGTIKADGLYTAPMSGGPFHVTAQSVADPSKEATALVMLTDAGFRMLNSSTLVPRVSHTATLLRDGKVLITGGCQYGPCDDPILSSAELFDPVTETFSRLDVHRSRGPHSHFVEGWDCASYRRF